MKRIKKAEIRSDELERELRLIMMGMKGLANPEMLTIYDAAVTEMVRTVGLPKDNGAPEIYAALMAALCHGLISGIRVMGNYLPSSIEGDRKVIVFETSSLNGENQKPNGEDKG